MDDTKAFPRSAFTTGKDKHVSYSRAGFTNTKQNGMNLRDYFAARALQLMDWKFYVGEDETKKHLKSNAKKSYQIADAMMEARKNG